MAELIRKDKLIDWSYREPQYYDSMNDRTDMRDFINGLPTTTEAEIRAKAIDEFAEKIRDWQKEVYKNDRYAGELDFLFKHIYEISEQLKEE